MGVGLLVVTTSAAGQSWVNTWGIKAGGTSSDPLTDSELTELMADAPLTLDSTDARPEADDYQGAQSLLAAIIGFHRYITHVGATVDSIYISDGRKNNPDSVYTTRALGFPCLRPLADPNAAVPLSIVWPIIRNPATFSSRPGRLSMRFCVDDASVKAGTRTGVQWTGPVVAASFAALLTETLVASALQNWFSGNNADPTSNNLVIPHYGTASLNKGQMIEGRPMSSLSSGEVTSRQLTKGRKRKNTP